MFSLFLDAVKRITIFLIISQTFLHLGIGVKYEKYVKFIISFMVIAQLFFSFGSYLGQKEKFFSSVLTQDYYKQWDEYMDKMEQTYEIKQEEVEKRIEKTNIYVSEEQENEEGTEAENDKHHKISIEKIVVSADEMVE
ncbi:MAG: hypothetical protein IKW30_10850 [Lachnospiraceae bacterium]|nr:hypothetical protein [Lachnospiraceae bacterium]